MVASASADACTKAPGGGTSGTPEISIAGSASVRIGSPPIESRAMPAAFAASASFATPRADRERGASSSATSRPAERQEHGHPRRLPLRQRAASRRSRSAGKPVDDRRRQHRAFLDVDEPVRQALVIAEQRRAGPTRSAVSTARRRLAGRRRPSRSTSGVKPCCASAATTKSRFSFRVASSGSICSAQPPQVPKWRQGGATRSGLGSSISTILPARRRARPRRARRAA